LQSALFVKILQAEGLMNFIWYRTNHSIMSNIYVLIFKIFVAYFYQIADSKSFVTILLMSIFSSKIFILFAASWHFERRERFDKVLISYKNPHIRSGRHDKTLDCRVNL